MIPWRLDAPRKFDLCTVPHADQGRRARADEVDAERERHGRHAAVRGEGFWREVPEPGDDHDEAE